MPAKVDAADIFGQAKIVDGDSLEIYEKEIRLYGIDAPEMDQWCGIDGEYSCGHDAKRALIQMIADNPVRCEDLGRDNYDRILAICYVNDVNLNAVLVREGWALAYQRYSMKFVADESDAKANRRGIWGQKPFINPWEWRNLMRRR
ncbi:MAG: thermonuclease family protein [Alphaproteobacteria bacterium]|nr:thermonuclease family protein [Alphaproteobacteria bacterium]